ncbi:EF-hand domain-containing protein [Sphingomonas sp. GlSt437]|uniref:EF-hand domain-containing protein n=1 Tax=Sphingomonas sp. GlSt437 TaxID=3389970 RepID=UPI003A8B091A
MRSWIIAAGLAGAIATSAAFAAQTDPTPAPQGPRAGGWLAHHGDTNGDGTVSRDEFLANAARHFDELDANHDGKITPDEIAAAHAAHGPDHGRRGPGGPGGDMMPPPPPPRGPGPLERLDADKDGKITRAEFNAPSNRHFDLLDTNHDGVIDQTELAAARAKMHDMMERHGGWKHPDGNTPPPPPPPGDAGN